MCYVKVNEFYASLNKNIAHRLIKEIKYPNKGFMLDVGHLMNTNLELQTEAESVEYILKVLQDLDELLLYIKGIHLNSSLSGKYVKNIIKRDISDIFSGDFNECYIRAFNHISKIDRHVPFKDPKVKQIIEFVNPKYLVYEFIADSLKELDEYVQVQNKVLNY